MPEHSESWRCESDDDDAAEDDALLSGTRGQDSATALQQQTNASAEDVGQHTRGHEPARPNHEETGAAQTSDRPMPSRATAMAVAREVQKEVRRKDPSLDTRPRTSRDDPEFMRSDAIELSVCSCAKPVTRDTPRRSDLLRLIS